MNTFYKNTPISILNQTSEISHKEGKILPKTTPILKAQEIISCFENLLLDASKVIPITTFEKDKSPIDLLNLSKKILKKALKKDQDIRERLSDIVQNTLSSPQQYEANSIHYSPLQSERSVQPTCCVPQKSFRKENSTINS